MRESGFQGKDVLFWGEISNFWKTPEIFTYCMNHERIHKNLKFNISMKSRTPVITG